MPLQPKLNRFSTASPVLISFDAQEFASGENFAIFNHFTSRNDTTVDYHMSSNSIFSSSITTDDTTQASIAKRMDVDFDTLFIVPRTVEGIALINIPYGAESTGNTTVYCLAKVYHVDGVGAETLLGTEQKTETLTGSGGGATKANAKIECLRVDLGSQHFATGDTLRINVELWASSTGTDTQYKLGHDPQNRVVDVFTETLRTDGGQSADSSSMTSYIPFRNTL